MADKTFTLEDLQKCKKVGVYFLYNNNKLNYIGFSRNVYQRILEHSFENKKTFNGFKAVFNDSVVSMEIMEVFMIHYYKPIENKLIVKDFFSYFHSLPSIIKEELGNKADMKYDDLYKSLTNIAKIVEKYKMNNRKAS